VGLKPTLHCNIAALSIAAFCLLHPLALLNLCANDSQNNWTLGASQADCSTLSPFRRFAQSLREDYDAVKAGVTMSISNGHFCWTYQPTENVEATNVWSCQDRFA